MKTLEQEKQQEQAERRVTKKDQITSLYQAGITDVQDLAMITRSRPSYVASVLQQEDKLPNYFDLYTTSAHPMNVYSKFFAGQLGYRDEEKARQGVDMLDRYHRQFDLAQDRAGQHHVLLMALTMFDRARWTGKEREAAIYRDWLVRQLQESKPRDSIVSRAVQKSRH
jgi:predicted RecB family nuclease